MSFTVYQRENYIGLYTGDWTEPHLTTLKVFTDFEEANKFLSESRRDLIRKLREQFLKERTEFFKAKVEAEKKL